MLTFWSLLRLVSTINPILCYGSWLADSYAGPITSFCPVMHENGISLLSCIWTRTRFSDAWRSLYIRAALQDHQTNPAWDHVLMLRSSTFRTIICLGELSSLYTSSSLKFLFSYSVATCDSNIFFSLFFPFSSFIIFLRLFHSCFYSARCRTAIIIVVVVDHQPCFSVTIMDHHLCSLSLLLLSPSPSVSSS